MNILIIAAYGLIWSAIGGFVYRFVADFELLQFGGADEEERTDYRNMMFAMGVFFGLIGGLVAGVLTPVFSLTCIMHALPGYLALLIPAFLLNLFDLGNWIVRRVL